jgi:hypothetical protein
MRDSQQAQMKRRERWARQKRRRLTGLEKLGFTFTLKLLDGSEQSSKVIYVALCTLNSD